MRFLYNMAVISYLAGIYVAALFSAKARNWLNGRKRWRQTMQQAVGQSDQHGSVAPPWGQEAGRPATSPGDREPDQPPAGTGQPKTIWFHCASLGEFEQGRPVIETFRKKFPHWRILLTFFSPSGYDHRKDYPHVDHVFYLPSDTPGHVRFFLDTWQPSVAVFVKYEYWYNFLNGLAKRDIPVLVVSAIFRPGQHFFRFYGIWFRRHLTNISCFFVQDETSRALLVRYAIPQAVVSGDTRFDRVYALRQAAKAFPLAKGFAGDHKVLVAGSTWPKDESLLLDAAGKSLAGVKIIIAPHEVHEANIRRLQGLCGGGAYRLSALDGQVPEDARVLIIDRIGMLAHLYQYGQVAYIGGGFGQGIHNILEAATFGLPVIFGPRYEKFAEARDLLKQGGAFCVYDGNDFDKRMNSLLTEPGLLKKAGEVCRRYVDTKRGATDIILNYLSKEVFGYELGN